MLQRILRRSVYIACELQSVSANFTRWKIDKWAGNFVITFRNSEGHSTKHKLDWTVGLDNWTGQLDWTIGLDFEWDFFHQIDAI